MSISILFVDSDEQLLQLLRDAAEQENYKSIVEASATPALNRFSSERFDVLVINETLPDMPGLELLERLRQIRSDFTAILTTDQSTVEIVVDAVKRGASDVVPKPYDVELLLRKINHIAGSIQPPVTPAPPAAPKSVDRRATNIVAESPVMRKLLEQVAAIAPFNTTVLITGETGTGKELIARTIHQQSPRAKNQMVALNCAAIPEHLLEDELFGHVKGAFTGAQTARDGRFEQANNGTLFLDEIGDMSLPLQSKLLRVLQEREFEKLGSSRTIKVDVRIIAATSADLERAIEEGKFRPDLFYRLNVVHLHLPPLHKRANDIRPLAQRLLASFCENAGLPLKKIDDTAWGALASYYWPGNVRQLQNAMERAAVLSGARTTIYLDDLPEEVRGGAPTGITPVLARQASRQGEPTTPVVQEHVIPDEGVNFDAVVTKVERELLLNSLNKAGGNKMRAAKLLNMKRTTFVEKLKRLDINTDESFPGGESGEDEAQAHGA